MTVINSLSQRSLGLAFKQNDLLSDLRLSHWKKSISVDTGSLNDVAIMTTAFDHSNKYPKELKLLTCQDDGVLTLNIYNQDAELLNICHVLAHENCIYDIAWSATGDKIFTACGDGSVGYLTVDASSVSNAKRIASGAFSMKSVVGKQDDPAVFASGSSHGWVFIWDTRSLSRPDIVIKGGHSSGTNKNSAGVRGLLFSNSNTLISCCSSEPVIKMWDLRRTYCNLSGSPKPAAIFTSPSPVTGFSSLALDDRTMRLYARAQNGSIQIFDIGNCRKEAESQLLSPEPSSSSFHVKMRLSPDKHHLVAGSTRGCLDIWNTHTQKLVSSLTPPDERDAHVELSGVDWIETQDHRAVISAGFEDGGLGIYTQTFNTNPDILKDPTERLNCSFANMKLQPTPKRPQTASSTVTQSPTLHLPSFVEDMLLHPATRPPSSQKSKTPGNWLDSLRREVTPKRNAPDSADKNKNRKKSRRRLPSSPSMSLPDFMQSHCKIPKLDTGPLDGM